MFSIILKNRCLTKQDTPRWASGPATPKYGILAHEYLQLKEFEKISEAGSHSAHPTPNTALPKTDQRNSHIKVTLCIPEMEFRAKKAG